MLLAIDIGNTNIVWGVFDGAKLVADWRVGTDHSKTTDEYAILLLDLLRVKGISPDRVAGVVLSTIPAVALGVGLSLVLTRTTLNVQSFMGAIMAIGVSVANAIRTSRQPRAQEALRHRAAPLGPS